MCRLPFHNIQIFNFTYSYYTKTLLKQDNFRDDSSILHIAPPFDAELYMVC